MRAKARPCPGRACTSTFGSDLAAGGGHIIEAETLFSHQVGRRVVQADAGQHRFVALAPAGIAIGGVDKLGDRARSVADDLGGGPLRHGDFLVMPARTAGPAVSL